MAANTNRTQYVFLIFTAASVVVLALSDRASRWLLSGAAPATFCLLLGSIQGNRAFANVPLWALVFALNLFYALASASWIFYYVFAATCYSVTATLCIFQFNVVSHAVRGALRWVLKDLQFTHDKIALFNLPALEIDRDVDGLMVVRGITISLSTLTIVAHGVEVGIKISDDLEIALVTDTVTIRLFRRIDVSDVYANLKGDQREMAFAHLDEKTSDANGNALMNSGTPLLQAVAQDSPGRSAQQKILMTEEMTEAAPPEDQSPKAAASKIESVSPGDAQASRRYQRTLAMIENTSVINQCRQSVLALAEKAKAENRFHPQVDEQGFRAAICAQLHDKPTIPHPPKQSIKVTTLQNLCSPRTRRFMHRLPLLLRLLLNPLAYFHVVGFPAITVNTSGKWAEVMLRKTVFAGIEETDSDIKHLSRRLCSWLADATFALELTNITGNAQVPVMTNSDIQAQLALGEVTAYRTVPEQLRLQRTVELGGGDARVTIPSHLLPHHEHLIPSKPTAEDEKRKKEEKQESAVKPKELKEREVEQEMQDTSNMTLSCHLRLPARFDQELLNFVTALVKATKLVEIKKDDSEPFDREVRGFKDITKHVTKHMADSMRDGMKKAAVDASVNDRLLAKIIGKIARKLETAQGDVGYSGNIPLALQPYRDAGKGEGSKLLA